MSHILSMLGIFFGAIGVAALILTAIDKLDDYPEDWE